MLLTQFAGPRVCGRVKSRLLGSRAAQEVPASPWAAGSTPLHPLETIWDRLIYYAQNASVCIYIFIYIYTYIYIYMY